MYLALLCRPMAAHFLSRFPVRCPPEAARCTFPLALYIPGLSQENNMSTKEITKEWRNKWRARSRIKERAEETVTPHSSVDAMIEGVGRKSGSSPN